MARKPWHSANFHKLGANAVKYLINVVHTYDFETHLLSIIESE
jgi:hypothetical protein